MAYGEYPQGEITIRDCKIQWHTIYDPGICKLIVRFDCFTRNKILSAMVKLTTMEEERFFTSSNLYRKTILELLRKADSLYAKEQIIAKRKEAINRDFI